MCMRMLFKKRRRRIDLHSFASTTTISDTAPPTEFFRLRAWQMCEFWEEREAMKKNRYTPLLVLLHMVPLSSAHAYNTEEKYDESCQRIYIYIYICKRDTRKKNERQRGKKEQKEIYIYIYSYRYLCCCLHIDQASFLLLSCIVSSIHLNYRKYFFWLIQKTILKIYF